MVILFQNKTMDGFKFMLEEIKEDGIWPTAWRCKCFVVELVLLHNEDIPKINTETTNQQLVCHSSNRHRHKLSMSLF